MAGLEELAVDPLVPPEVVLGGESLDERRHSPYGVAAYPAGGQSGDTAELQKSPLEWLKLTIDPDAHRKTTATTFGPFAWQRMPQL